MAARRFAPLLAVVALAAGCGLELGGPAPFRLPATDGHLADTPRNLPTHHDGGGSMLAIWEGVLVLEEPCLYLASGGVPDLVVWPSDYWLDGTTLRSGHRAVAEVGDRLHLVGGNIPVAAVASELTNPVDPACAREHALVVGGVSRLDGKPPTAPPRPRPT